jgi:hypothetical protein
MAAPGSTMYEKIQSAGIIFSLVVSGIAAWFSWSAYQLKQEDIFFTASPTNCKIQDWHHRLADGKLQHILPLCWEVTIANKSENKLAIISSRTYSLDAHGKPIDEGRGAFSDFIPLPIVQEVDGNKASFPFSLDGGTPKVLVVYVPIIVPSQLDNVMKKILEEEKKPFFSDMDLATLESRLANHFRNLLGDEVEKVTKDGRTYFRYPANAKSLRVFWEVTTGRGGKFVIPLHWPGTELVLYRFMF